MFERIILDRARENRGLLAYKDEFSSITYKIMADDIGRCIGWLTARGVMPGDRVALNLKSFYQHWVLFFAIEAKQAISIATSNLAPLTSSRLAFVGANLYITDSPLGENVSIPGEVADRGWLLRVRKFRSLLQLGQHRADHDPVCIVLSSGTTGTPKKVLLTRAVIDVRVIRERSAELITDGSRVLMNLPNDSIGALMTVLSTWAVGGTVCIRSGNLPAEQSINTLKPTMIAGAPSHFSKLLSELPDHFASDRPIGAATGGGALAVPIATAIQQKLRGQIKLSYASTEMGFVARGDFELSQEHHGAIGFILPYVQVLITDQAGNLLPHGEVGEIWVRGAHVVNGYLEDQDQTNLSFRDGWYHPGDLGTLRSDGLLSIHGRTDDLINHRGAKVLPSLIEESILRSGLVTDIAVFSACGPGTVEPQIWIACVIDRALNPTSLAAHVPKIFTYVVAVLEKIPRNAMGKIERNSLRSKVESGEILALSR